MIRLILAMILLSTTAYAEDKMEIIIQDDLSDLGEFHVEVEPWPITKCVKAIGTEQEEELCRQFKADKEQLAKQKQD